MDAMSFVFGGFGKDCCEIFDVPVKKRMAFAKKMSQLSKGMRDGAKIKKSLKELVSPWADGASMNVERWVAVFGLYHNFQ